MLRDDFAKDLWTGTAGFIQNVRLIGQLDEPNNLLEWVLEAFTSISESAELPALRVYVDNGQRFDLFDAGRLVGLDGPMERSTAEARIRASLGHKRFCMTLNGLTKWSSNLDRFVCAELIEPLFQLSGWRGRGVDTYSFIGNYGFTPFGIHDDNDHSLLIHLGPAPKSVWIIPRDKYLAHHGNSTSAFNYAKYEGIATRYVLQAGDVVFIPMGDFHVFCTDDFSVTLGVTFFPSNPASRIRDALEEALLLAEGQQYEPASISTSLPVALQFVELRRESNGHITTLPTLCEISFDDLDVLIRPPHHRLLLHEHGRNLTIFARGRDLSVKANPALRRLVEQINLLQSTSVLSLCDTEPSLEPDVIRYITRILTRWRFFARANHPIGEGGRDAPDIHWATRQCLQSKANF